MAETIYTKDGKCHTLLGSTTPASIIRDYCCDAVAEYVEHQLDREDRKEQSDLVAYEADLEHLHRMMQDWVDELESLCDLCENRKFTKATLAAGIRGVIYNIEKEL
ncbi:hypothetical protein B5E80_15315 [Flavonifractor sp. An135]|nr:hypothetical protein [Flavonifractor sp. An135]OUQ22166.1 hypothetical protein B5E80_15315 [Flavonifractor sp. An135]